MKVKVLLDSTGEQIMVFHDVNHYLYWIQPEITVELPSPGRLNELIDVNIKSIPPGYVFPSYRDFLDALC